MHQVTRRDINKALGTLSMMNREAVPRSKEKHRSRAAIVVVRRMERELERLRYSNSN